MKLKVGDTTVDLNKAFPTAWKDIEALEKLELILSGGDLQIASPSKMTAFVHYFVSKQKSDVTEDEIRDLPTSQLTKALQYCTEKITADFEAATVPPTKGRGSRPSIS